MKIRVLYYVLTVTCKTDKILILERNIYKDEPCLIKEVSWPQTQYSVLKTVPMGHFCTILDITLKYSVGRPSTGRR